MLKHFFLNHRENFLRLAMALCLVQLLVFFGSFSPLAAKIRQESPLAENGVGGGTLIDNVISGIEEDFDELQLALESGVLEPEAFSRPRILLYSSYTIKKDDKISELAVTFGLNQDTLISVNNIKNSRLIQIGQILKIPNQDGIYYTVKGGDTLSAIAERHNSDSNAIQTVNELFSDRVQSGTVLFIPDARLDWINLQEINGDLFIWPVSGRITSPYGYRNSPFTGTRQFHSGMDISAVTGTPVRAAMSGRVSTVGYDNVLGNFAVISHHSGYRTLYGHMSVVRAKSGAYVGTGERIGDVGSTGQSTGPHLHFTVYKNGITINPRTLMQ